MVKRVMVATALLMCLLMSVATMTACSSSSASTSSSQGSASQASSEAVSSESDGPTTQQVADFHNVDLGNGWSPTSSLELKYAKCFTVDYYDGGYKLFCLSDGSR